MKTTLTLQLRVFPVQVKDQRTGEERTESITLDKSQLRAAQLVGQSSKELICRLCERQGFEVLDIGKARKETVELDLEKLFFEGVGT